MTRTTVEVAELYLTLDLERREITDNRKDETDAGGRIAIRGSLGTA